MNSSGPQRSGLLVSVRSVAEAEAALAGGADLIDVKEPSRGSLGRADDDVIAAVVRAVGGRKPVSAALGELSPTDYPRFSCKGLSYVKWGLAGWAEMVGVSWQEKLRFLSQTTRNSYPKCRMVIVAYADWQRAQSPPPAEVWESSRHLPCDGLLLDTFHKDGSTLLDWMALPKVALLVRLCRNAGLSIALAGSLGREEIARLRRLKANWFGVRGAACRQMRRDSEIDSDRVRQLAHLLAEPVTTTGSGS